MTENLHRHFVQHSLHHNVHGVQFTASYKASLPDQFVQSFGVASYHAASTVDCSKEQCTGNNRLIENIHYATNTKGSQLS